MTIKRTVHEDGSVTDYITLTEEENNSIDLAHSIVNERYKAEGIGLSKEDKELFEWVFQGMLRYDGINALLDYARTVEVQKPKKTACRSGYC